MTSALFLAFALSSATIGTESAHRFALVVGHSDGGGDRLRLRYAVADARAFSLVLTELGGVDAADAALVLEPGIAGLTASLRQTAQRLGAAKARGERTEMIFYYSGHSDEAGLLLGGERLSYADLRRTVDAMAADLRVVVLDSCASGELTRTKGVVRRPAFLSEVGQARGHAFLTSSSATESAQESDAIGASFFTYFLVTGLRGAADVTGDGRVSLSEAYQFAFHETLARTERTTLGGQHPTYAMNIAGTGDVVLTDLTRAEATLVLAEQSAGRFFIRDGEQRLVAELRKLPGRTTELALPAGSYAVLVEREGDRFASTLALAPGARVVFDDTALVRVPGEPVTARGPSPQELASRAEERVRIAKRVYEREKLRVEATGTPLNAFHAFAGDVTVPLAMGDFFDRAERPDLVTAYEENVALNAWLAWGGMGSEVAFGAGVVAVAFTFVNVIPFSPAAERVLAGTIIAGFIPVLASLVVAIVGVLRDPTPIGLVEAQAVAREHNLRLQRRLGLQPESRKGAR